MRHIEIREYLQERLCSEFFMSATDKKIVFQRTEGKIKTSISIAIYDADEIKLGIETSCIVCDKKDVKILYDNVYNTSTRMDKASVALDKALNEICNKESCKTACSFKHT